MFRPGISSRLSVCILICGLSAVSEPASTARAEEPVAEFVDGLRERKYFDVAVDYLNELKGRPGLPAEIKDTLDLELGMTYRAMGTSLRVPEDRDQALTNAEKSLNAFVKAHPDHERAALANSELGQLLFEKARSLIWDSESESAPAKIKQLQQQARTMIERAKAIYQAAHDQYKAKYDEFPKFIDKTKEPDEYDRRLQAEVKYLRAWFNLVRCTYERGQTFDKGSPERNETLTTASKQFEEIHAARRTNPIGLQSRLMMGKCFQEQDDLARALGIYNEMLLNDPTVAPTVRVLRSIAVQYRLICLNHEQRNDHQLVMQEANEWISDKGNRSLAFTEIGLGILWEKAIAEEKYAADRTLEEKDKNTVLRQALADAKQVARFPGPYQSAASAMTRRISAALGDKNAEPKDFATAFERARGLVSELKGLEDDLKEAKTGADKQKARQAIDLHLNDIGRMFDLALSLRDADSDPKAVAQARYLLSYVYMRQRKSFDAIILARYCMTQDREHDPESAQSATEIAINAAVQAFNDAGDDQSFELALLGDICEQIIEQYPQSSRGNEARMRLGQVYRDLKKPKLAAERYLTVPGDYSGYASARMQAGQSYWLAWVTETAKQGKGDAEAPDEETLKQWKADARKYLVEGIGVARKNAGDGAPSDEAIAAEVSLATILNLDGEFAETIKRLTGGDKNSVVAKVNVPEGKQRPEKGIASAAFAGQAYRLLLRAYVGEQDIDKALATMEKLENVGGQDVTAIYTQLGRELQEELERLKQSGEDERRVQVRKSFEEFLAKVNENRDKSDYNSLLWIGETYFGLGQGAEDDPAAAADYFAKASQAYQDILDNNLVEGSSVLAIKLRQVKCMRAQGQYQQAIDLAKTILSTNPMSLDVQFEAAHTLADWGDAESGAQPDKLLAAIQGQDDVIWGWSGLTTRLQARRNSPEWDNLRDQFLEARYEYMNSRYRYAKTGAADADKQLQSGLGELTMFALAFNELDDQWYAKFDDLYQSFRADRGLPPEPLKRPEKVELPPEAMVATTEADEPEEAAAAEEEVTNIPPPEPPNMILIGAMVAIGCVGGFLFYRTLTKPRQRRSFASADGPKMPSPAADSFSVPSDSDEPDFSAFASVGAPPKGPVAAPVKKKKKVAPATAARTKPTGATAKSASTKPAATKAPAAKAAPGTRPAAAPGAAQKAAAGKKPAAAGTPVKKKRVLTPEEMARYKAAKAAKAKAAAQAAAKASASGQPQKKVVKKRPVSPDDPAAVKKKIKKRPPSAE